MYHAQTNIVSQQWGPCSYCLHTMDVFAWHHPGACDLNLAMSTKEVSDGCGIYTGYGLCSILDCFRRYLHFIWPS